MLGIDEKKVLKEKVERLPWEARMKVENDEIVSRLLNDGVVIGVDGKIKEDKGKCRF